MYLSLTSNVIMPKKVETMTSVDIQGTLGNWEVMRCWNRIVGSSEKQVERKISKINSWQLNASGALSLQANHFANWLSIACANEG